MDSIELEPAVSLAEANATIGLAGKITYSEVNSVRYYNFRFEFSDCFDGCDNYREWQFAVNPDCSVNYLGFTEFGFFGVQPLPAPSNCNLFTTVQENMEAQLRVYPNPVRGSQVSVHFQSQQAGPVQLQLFDSRASRVWQTERTALRGSQVWTFPVNGLPPGVYLLRVAGAGQVVTIRLIR